MLLRSCPDGRDRLPVGVGGNCFPMDSPMATHQSRLDRWERGAATRTTNETAGVILCRRKQADRRSTPATAHRRPRWGGWHRPISWLACRQPRSPRPAAKARWPPRLDRAGACGRDPLPRRPSGRACTIAAGDIVRPDMPRLSLCRAGCGRWTDSPLGAMGRGGRCRHRKTRCGRLLPVRNGRAVLADASR